MNNAHSSVVEHFLSPNPLGLALTGTLFCGYADANLGFSCCSVVVLNLPPSASFIMFVVTGVEF
jgi:hypothetical protein